MLEIVIREMQWHDVPKVLEIERMSFSTPWSEMSFLNEIYKTYALTRVAVLENNVIGYICVNYILNEGHILNLAVHPDFRRRGIGTQLVEEVLNELIKKGCRYLYLEVRFSNLEAKKFYEHLGFKVVGIRKKYYTYPNEDAALMMRGL